MKTFYRLLTAATFPLLSLGACDGSEVVVTDPGANGGGGSGGAGGSTADTCSDGCMIGGVCVADGAGCDDGIACTGDGTCSGATGQCTVGDASCATGEICDVSADACAVSCGGCIVGAVCFGDGQINPAAACETCDVATSATAWSANDGASCGTGMVCGAGSCGDASCCNDVDECTLNTDNCDANAACANTEGGFDCTCNSGYSGNGTLCIDDDECTLGTDTCDTNATCTNTDASFSCECNAGFTGNGASCTDDNECTLNTNDCAASAACTNIDGGFTCACPSTEWGDGKVCGAAVLITEVDQDIARDSIGSGCEGGELTNLGDEFIDINGWSIAIYDNSATPFEVFTISQPTPLAPGETVAFRENCGIAAADVVLTRNWSWGSRNGAVVLLNDVDVVVDVAAFGTLNLSAITTPAAIPAAEWVGANTAQFHGGSVAQPITWQRVGETDSQSAADWAAQANSWGAFNAGLTH